MTNGSVPASNRAAFKLFGGFHPQTSFKPDRVELERWSPFNALRESDQLLTRQFESLAKALLANTKAIDQLWELRRTHVALLRNDPSQLDLSPGSLASTVSVVLPMATQARPKSRMRRGSSKAQPVLLTQLGVGSEQVVAYLKQLRRQILHHARVALEQESDLQSLTGVTHHLVERSELYSCSCGCFQRDGTKRCEVCNRHLSRDPRSVVGPSPQFVHLVEHGVYLELGISQVLRAKGFKVLTGAHVTGLSGVEHEVDVLARSSSGGVSLVIEVTRTGANIDEMADLVLRRLDIPANGYALVSSTTMSADCADFAKAHRIAVFPSIQENPKGLVDWLEAIQREHSVAIRS